MEQAADSFTSAALLNEVMIELVTDLRRLLLAGVLIDPMSARPARHSSRFLELEIHFSTAEIHYKRREIHYKHVEIV